MTEFEMNSLKHIYMSLLNWDKFICQSLPTSLPDWVKDWERQESGIYLVYFDPNNSQW